MDKRVGTASRFLRRARRPSYCTAACPASPILPQAMYTFRGETQTFERLFIVPIGQDDEATEYEAVFT